MKRSIPLALLAALLLSLPSCGAGTAEEPRLTVVCTTFPIYLFASSLTEGVEGVEITTGGRRVSYRSHQLLTAQEAVLWDGLADGVS